MIDYTRSRQSVGKAGNKLISSRWSEGALEGHIIPGFLKINDGWVNEIELAELHGWEWIGSVRGDIFPSYCEGIFKSVLHGARSDVV